MTFDFLFELITRRPIDQDRQLNTPKHFQWTTGERANRIGRWSQSLKLTVRVGLFEANCPRRTLEQSVLEGIKLGFSLQNSLQCKLCIELS